MTLKNTLLDLVCNVLDFRYINKEQWVHETLYQTLFVY